MAETRAGRGKYQMNLEHLVMPERKEMLKEKKNETMLKRHRS